MSKYSKTKIQLEKNGFSITGTVFNEKELNLLVQLIENRSSEFSIRQLLNKVPEIHEVIFNNQIFKELYNAVCDKNYFLSKAIYFNKPGKSNWFVGYHQDLSISVKEKKEREGYINWTLKKGQIGVIPPYHILESTVTFRIHLDEANNTNGALKVIANSHDKGIIRIDESFDKLAYGN